MHPMRTLIDNKKAYFDFEVLDKYEAGIVLQGWEVKSFKTGKGSVNGSFIKIFGDEAFLVNSIVPNWKSGEKHTPEQERRQRKLLLQKNQIKRINSELKQKGITAVPLEVIENDGKLVKVIIGLVRGKKKFDKRQKLKEKDLQRRLDQDRKRYNF